MKDILGYLIAFVVGVLFGILIAFQWQSINSTAKQSDKTDYTVTLNIKLVEE